MEPTPWLLAYYDGSLEDVLRDLAIKPGDTSQENAKATDTPGGGEETNLLQERKAA